MRNFKMAATVVLFGLLTAFGVKNAVSGYQIGDMATDFKLKNVDNKMVSMADYKEAKGFIVIFTCNHCPYAVAYEDRIIALDKKYKKLGYPVIAINPNNPEVQPQDSFELMQVRAKEKKFTFRICLMKVSIFIRNMVLPKRLMFTCYKKRKQEMK
jgi:glutathione peroxidase-family protein